MGRYQQTSRAAASGGGGSRGRRRPDTGHSELRLCRQVERRLHLVFAGELGDPALQGVTLDSVLPGPPGQLVVRVHTDGSQAYDLVRQRLEAARTRLRTEVAAAISRRRTPDLVFVVIDDEDKKKELASLGILDPEAHSPEAHSPAAADPDEDLDDDEDEDFDEDEDEDFDEDEDEDFDEDEDEED